MRRLRVPLVTLLGLLLVIAGAVAVATARGDSGGRPVVNYVALGDSYSAGVGAGAPTAASGACGRSARAYPQLWAAVHHPARFDSVACSGATTADVLGSQVSALRFDTSLVTITIGGNDENFGRIMTRCTLFLAVTCARDVRHAEADARANLGNKLLRVFGAIAAAAPLARVVVLGYPHLYDLRDHCVGLSRSARSEIDTGIDLVDSMLQAAAAIAGFRYVDVRAAFAAHEICDHAQWLHALELFHLRDSYHPTASGQAQGYLPALTAAAR